MDMMIALAIMWFTGVFAGFLTGLFSRDIIAIIKHKEKENKE